VSQLLGPLDGKSAVLSFLFLLCSTFDLAEVDLGSSLSNGSLLTSLLRAVFPGAPAKYSATPLDWLRQPTRLPFTNNTLCTLLQMLFARKANRARCRPLVRNFNCCFSLYAAADERYAIRPVASCLIT